MLRSAVIKDIKRSEIVTLKGFRSKLQPRRIPKLWRSASFAENGFWRYKHCLPAAAPSRLFSTSCKRLTTPVPEAYPPNDAPLPLSDAQRRTIYALSTAPGKAGVAVVRVSGPDALTVWTRMVRRTKKCNSDQPIPWKLDRCHIVHPQSKEILDDGLAVFFKGPRSFTTEDVLELHTHSGRALIASVLSALSTIPSLRPAEPGEFTKRAFLADRLDLTQVEGLKDLIDAETEIQRRSAVRAAGGEVKKQLDELRTGIVKCQAMVEALLDFGEGEDIEEGVYEEAQRRAKNLLEMIQTHLSDARRGEITRSGIRLAIFGPPNAGKSSLLNFLAQRDAAIVTPIPGTTRDILELSLDLAGLPVIVADTAGLRHTQDIDIVEKIGISRAKEAVINADVSLCVLSLPDINFTHDEGGVMNFQVPDSVRELITPDTYFLLNKSDLFPLSRVLALDAFQHTPVGGVQKIGKAGWIASLQSGEGTQQFLDGLGKALKERFDISDTAPTSQSHTPIITRSRHRVHLESAAKFLEAFLDTPPQDAVLGAEELRYAARAIGKISGIIDVEDVLDVVFRDFCIGK